MGHVPHVYVPRPWPDDRYLSLGDAAIHHLRKVLRRADGAEVSYTDGAGLRGSGELEGDLIARGREILDPRPPVDVTIAVAPPKRAERARFLVEKLAELGVSRLTWLSTHHGEGTPPRDEKANAWAVAALEQSRGAWRMEIDGPMVPSAVPPHLLVADPSGAPPAETAATTPGPWTVAIGPEGGFVPGEVPAGTRLVTLGGRILRTETAAIAAAVLLLDAARRGSTASGQRPD